MTAAESLEAPPEKLLEWLRGIENVACIRIEARHLVAGSEGGSPVATFEIAEREDGGERFDGPALFRRLEEDAEGFGGIQRYTLLAYREGSKAPRDRLTLRVDGGTDSGASAGEPANATGLVAQAHRHNEALMGMVVRMCGTALDTLSKQNAKLGEALEKATEEKVELWRIMGEVSKHDKDREDHKHALALKEKQADVLRDGIKLLVPGLISKILPSKEAGDESLGRLVESLTDEQRAAIFSTLSPDQQIALGGFLDTYMQKRATDAQKEESADGK